MADDQQLSAQDVQDLQDIASKLPAGHPAKSKIAALLASQPTQFERQHSDKGALATAASDVGDVLKSGLGPIYNAYEDYQKGGLKGVATGAAYRTIAPEINAAKTIVNAKSDYERRKQAGYNPVYRAVAPIQEATGVAPLLNPSQQEEAASRGATGEVIGHNVLPATAATALPAYRVGSALRGAIGNAAFEPTSSTLTPSESPTGSMIEYGLKPGVSKALRVAGATGGAVAGALPGIAEGKPYLAYGGGSVGAGLGAAAGPSMFEAMFRPQPKPAFPGAPLPAAEDFYAARGAEANAANNIAAKFARNQAKAQAALAKVPDWEQPAHDVLELGSPEYPGPTSKIPSRVPAQFRGDPFAPQTAPPEVPQPSSIVAPGGGARPRVGSEGRAATWTNERVQQLAAEGNREAIQQATLRGLELPPNARYVMGDPNYSDVTYNPRDVTMFTPEGTPIRQSAKGIQRVPLQGNPTLFTQHPAPYTITNEMGIRWANTEGLPKISIPPNMAEADIPSYVAEKQALQKKGRAELFQ